MTQDNFGIFDFLNMSEAESFAISEFTGNCCKFAEYCEQEFKLNGLDAYVVAGLAISHFKELVETNSELKQVIQKNAEYMKHKRKELSKKTDKNPPDDAG